MTEELAAKNKTTPEGLADRILVDTPDRVAARLRDFTQVGVNHHIFAIAASDEWPDLQDVFELLAREVVPRARA